MTTVFEKLAKTNTELGTVGRILAYRLVAEQVPLGGRGTPVSPPTYLSDEKGVPKFARASNVPIPEGMAQTTLGQILMDEAGRPRTGDAVVIDSIGACSHTLGEVLEAELTTLLDRRPPGIYVDQPQESDLAAAIASTWKSKGAGLTAKAGVSPERFETEVRWAVEQTYANDRVSTWRASHRQADAVIRYADDPATGQQIWAGGDIGDLIRSMSASTGDDLIANVPSSAILGFWLSSRSPRLHKLARSAVSEVMGYGVTGVLRGATKSDLMGGITADQASLKVVGGELVLEHKKPDEVSKPSKFGFGQIPNEPQESAVVCQSILLRGTLSAQALVSQLTASPEHLALAEAMGVLALLGQMDLGFRRSGADFITGARRLTLLVSGGGEHESDVDAVREAARATVIEHGSLLAEPIQARASKIQIELIAGRVASGLLTGGKDE